MQLPEDSEAARELGAMILGALGSNALFISAALPARVFPPLFNRYSGGQSFGTHVDNAIRQINGTSHRIRTDSSVTLFFSNPDEYDGHWATFMGLPHSPQNFRGLSKLAPQGSQRNAADETDFFSAAFFRRRAQGAPALQRSLELVDLGQHAGEFLLQAFLGRLVVGVREFADAIFELQVAQVLVNRRLAFVQMLERRYGSGPVDPSASPRG